MRFAQASICFLPALVNCLTTTTPSTPSQPSALPSPSPNLIHFDSGAQQTLAPATAPNVDRPREIVTAAPGAATPSQAATITTQWLPTWNGVTVTWVEVIFTQTFATQAHDVMPSPSSGSIGLGTVTVVAKGAIQTGTASRTMATERFVGVLLAGLVALGASGPWL